MYAKFTLRAVGSTGYYSPRFSTGGNEINRISRSVGSTYINILILSEDNSSIQAFQKSKSINRTNIYIKLYVRTIFGVNYHQGEIGINLKL